MPVVCEPEPCPAPPLTPHGGAQQTQSPAEVLPNFTPPPSTPSSNVSCCNAEVMPGGHPAHRSRVWNLPRPPQDPPNMTHPAFRRELLGEIHIFRELETWG